MMAARPGSQPHHVAVAGRDLLGHLQVTGEGSVFHEDGGARRGSAPRCAGRDPLRTCRLQLVAAGVAGDVDARMIALGVEAHPPVGELVLEVADGDLIARG